MTSFSVGQDVIIPNIDLAIFADMLEWCEDNAGEREWHWCVLSGGFKEIIWFYNDEDATAFRLRFGL